MAAKRNKPNELYISRLFDAPVEHVWAAWVNPDEVAQWWGPRGFTITTDHKDVRTGGTWRYVMHGPDGVDYPNHTKFLEVEEHARLVYDHGGYDDRPPLFRVTVTFTRAGKNQQKTQMDMTMALATPEAAEETRRFIKKAGGDSTWDRLAEYLAPTETFVINRSFAAPIEVLFDMWTDPQHVAAWTPPTGFTMEFRRAEIRPGGTSFYSMSGPNGVVMYGRATYGVIERPHRIEYTQSFCDEHEGPARHPFAPTWPESMHTVVTLTAEDDARTRVTVEWKPVATATDVEVTTFRNGKSGMTQGWTGSFDKLDDYLTTRR